MCHLCKYGTAALELALIACGVKPNTEVVIPSLTFCAAANAVSKVGAVQFVDVNFSTFGLDQQQRIFNDHYLAQWYIDKQKYWKPNLCNIASAYFWSSVQFDEILSVAKKFDLVVIEDAAEALGSVYKGKKCGTLDFCSNKL